MWIRSRCTSLVVDNNVVPGDALWVKEADVGRVEGTDQVDPGADVRLLVDPANIWTHLDSTGRSEEKEAVGYTIRGKYSTEKGA